MKNKFKVLFAGGHAATTAVALIEEVRAEKLNWKIYFIGSKNAVEGKNISTLEFESLPKMGVTFFPLMMGRVQRRFTVWTIPSLLKIPFGFLEALYLLAKIRPNVTLSFGGLSSVPVVIASKIFGIPVVVHEQTAAAGRANLLSGKFANKIALAREESVKYFPGDKTVITGNPVAKRMFLVGRKTGLGNPPTIFVTGGSRGAQSINDVIGVILPRLLAGYRVIHQTGEIDIGRFEKIKKLLPKNLTDNYRVFARVEPTEVAGIYEKVDIVISRAGANTVSDILASGRPAILIPLPISYLDEQAKNAGFLAKFGFARVVKQDELTVERLLREIREISSNYNKFIEKAEKRKNPDFEAARKLILLLKSFLK